MSHSHFGWVSATGRIVSGKTRACPLGQAPTYPVSYEVVHSGWPCVPEGQERS